ncbi:hypothetical protein [Streptomyces griseosporeus]|uniref:hypothetical protein n=1 Tax=Streptomyces griseosporeus TaxID=1910 RepID=UPI0037011AAA
MRTKALLAGGAALLLAAPVLAGCSSDEPKQEFAVPKALCGVDVPGDALARLLPASGERVTSRHEDGGGPGAGLCNVSVDGTQVLVVSMERIPADRTSAGKILTERLRGFDQKYAEGGSIAYRAGAAASLVKCRAADVQKEDISLFVQTWKPGRQDESAMKDLISGYTASLKKQQPCLKKNG